MGYALIRTNWRLLNDIERGIYKGLVDKRMGIIIPLWNDSKTLQTECSMKKGA